MTTTKALKAPAITFFVSGLYDAFGGFYYSFMVGVGRSVDSPPTHTFYALFIASFMFCFAYLQQKEKRIMVSYRVVTAP